MISLQIDKDLKERLEKIAELEKRSRSQIIRFALIKFLEDFENATPKLRN